MLKSLPVPYEHEIYQLIQIEKSFISKKEEYFFKNISIEDIIHKEIKLNLNLKITSSSFKNNFNFVLDFDGKTELGKFEKRFGKINKQENKYYKYLPKYNFLLRETISRVNVLRFSVRKDTITHDNKNHQNPFPKEKYWEKYKKELLKGSVLSIGDFKYHFKLEDFFENTFDKYNITENFTTFCKLATILSSENYKEDLFTPY